MVMPGCFCSKRANVLGAVMQAFNPGQRAARRSLGGSSAGLVEVALQIVAAPTPQCARHVHE
jgi:hypothetical protein